MHVDSYETPAVTDLGTLADLTQGGTGNLPDPITAGALAGS